MLDLQSLHVRARARKAVVAVERGLEDAARAAVEEGLVASAPVEDRLPALVAWTRGTVDAVVLASRPEQGEYAWLLLVREAGKPSRLVAAVEPALLREAARVVARLGAEPEAAHVLGADAQLARDAGLVARPDLAASAVSIVYGPPETLGDVVEALLWRGAEPLAEVRLDVPRPLVASAGDPVEAVALAGALAGTR